MGIRIVCHTLREATLEVRRVDERGRNWLRSGDIGLLDEEGYLYVVDRKKDMILSGGQNTFPQDIESVLGRPCRNATLAWRWWP